MQKNAEEKRYEIMFCHACGTKLNDGAAFCHSCGAQIAQVIPKENTEISTEKSAELPAGARTHTITNESMKDLGIQQTVFKNRIESVEDRETNDRLFTLYGKLVEPLSIIEQKLALIDQKQEVYGLRAEYEPLGGKLVTFLFYIAWFAIIVFINDKLQINILHLPQNSTNMSGPEAIKWLLVIFFTPYVLARITKIVISIIRMIIEALEIKELQNHTTKEIEGIKQEISQMITKLTPYLVFVPPAYRNSASMHFFYDSYLNTRVSNLAQAITACDAEIRARRIENKIQTGFDSLRADIADFRNEVGQRLSSIEYNQGTIITELANVNASVWAANILF